MTTPDLSDKFPDISFINLQFKNFGSEGFYSGKVETVSCPDDNSKVKKITKFKKFTKLKDKLFKIYHWYKNNKINKL